MDISIVRKAYFLGIGGIGMSAIARYFNDKKVEVYGYDLTSTTLTKKLEEEGMVIHYQEDINAIPTNIDIVVYTPAVPSSHTELVYLKQSDIPVMKRSEVLGLISKRYQTIAIAGTHGKTSTSTILAYLLDDEGIGCTSFIGGICKNWNTNYRFETGDYMVAEADEYDRSFLQLCPQILVILSMDADHLDIYGTHEEMILAYEQLTLQMQVGGTLIIKQGIQSYFSDEWKAKMDSLEVEVIEFGDSNANISVTSLSSKGFESEVNARVNDSDVAWTWNTPGEYNASNASIAVSIAMQIGLSRESIVKKLASYQGVKRRLELIYSDEQFTLIDDYAHHPDELNAVLSTVRKLYPVSSITGIFQPHLYTRTRDHFEGFAEQLSRLDCALILPIYPAREEAIPGITSELIVEQMTLAIAEAVQHETLKTRFEQYKHEIIITLGAGNLDKHHPMLLDYIEKQING